MRQGRLKQGDRMPSLRECEATLGFSRTSVETAYMMLAADGYIYSQEKIGFYVTDMMEKIGGDSGKSEAADNSIKAAKCAIKYDFATIKEDRDASCLDLWRRYMKSALRAEDRLLSYALNQGEEDLREEIAAYVRHARNIICTKDDIVIGAGFQNLLHILIPLIEGDKTVSFPTKDFIDGSKAFADAGFDVSYRNKDCHVLYVTPAYMTKWGEVMTMRRRHEITEHAREHNHLIIEDDYQNEFVFGSQPTPSLYAMNGGENVAYLGSFSRILLPSIRISFLILPKGYKERYTGVMRYYNQTAAKAEQIALAQFLRDGHMRRHIKKIRRIYSEKRELMISALERYLKNDTRLLLGDSGMEIGLVVEKEDIADKLADKGIAITVVRKENYEVTLLLSCSGVENELIEPGIRLLNEIIEEI